LKSKASSFFVRPDWIDPKKKLKTKLLKSWKKRTITGKCIGNAQI
jgi:hypothetical protein